MSEPLEFRARVSTVRSGGRALRVLRPARAVTGLAVHDRDFCLDVFVDRPGAELLTAAWMLAARSPRSLIHLPVRHNPRPAGFAPDDAHNPAALDLVLLHHSLQFPPSRWPEVRARLGAGSLHTATVPASAVPATDDVDHDRWYHREFRDHLRFDLAAATLFVIGSRTAFEERAGQLLGLARDGPAYLARNPAGHSCAELSPGPYGRVPNVGRGTPGELHIQFVRGWRL